jgi:hypothetical protein
MEELSKTSNIERRTSKGREVQQGTERTEETAKYFNAKAAKTRRKDMRPEAEIEKLKESGGLQTK